MKIAIVGAGAAGLCAIKHAVAFGCDVIAYEQSAHIGGTWVYSDKTGTDNFGNAIHSSMYKGLHTNLPKELMSFPDFLFPPNELSFVPASDVLQYLNLYADKFMLRQFVKFEHQVVRVRPMLDGAWEVMVRNLAQDKLVAEMFDAVFVCNGHFSTPSFPHYRDNITFRGNQIHSHDYRRPKMFSNRKVLVIGAGPSGVDITQEIAKCAEKVFWSNHLKDRNVFAIPNIIQKHDVEELTQCGARFVDGTTEIFDDIVYCTGYQYTFPFLSIDCEISCEKNYVKPLFKHCLNINRPTMAVIGLPISNCPFQTFDLQIRFCLTFMTGRKVLPSREEMFDVTEEEMNERWQRGISKRKAHILGTNYQEAYYKDLATTAGIVPIKPVVVKMYERSRRIKEEDLINYRRYKFTVLDDENFEAHLLPI